jgi:hypothetical protein
VRQNYRKTSTKKQNEQGTAIKKKKEQDNASIARLQPHLKQEYIKKYV